MKIYLVSRTDSVGYDEYDAFVVKAKNKMEALELCNAEWGQFTEYNTEIEEINLKGKPEVLLGSFNAG